jgi:DNA-binding NarL/FixJ family response regulator
MLLLSGMRLPDRKERGIELDTDRLRVVIADDHPGFRQALAKMLTQSGIEVVGQAATGAGAIETVAASAPDVVLMDLNMPRLSGVDATRRLAHRSPATRVLMLSVSAEEADVTDALLAGASGYILKDDAIEDVVAAIRAVAVGQSVISPQIASMMLDKVRDRERIAPGLPPVELTDRELEMLRLVADGESNQEIAESLVIQPTTVRQHVSSILLKLQADNRLPAAYAVRSRVV